MQKGIAALPTILIITLILVEISMTLAFLSYHLGWIETKEAKLKKTLYFAETGIYDSISKIERNLNFTCSSSTISFGNNQEAEVTVLKDSPSNGQDTIISIGKYENIQKKIKAIVDIDQQSGKVSISSWKEQID